MTSPKRIVGFMASARQIVQQTPGLTAQEVYKRANEMAKQRGTKLSAAKSPQGSLVATLHKHHAPYGLERRRVGRQYLYYINAASPASPPATGIATNSNVSLTLPEEVDKRLEALVSLGRFRDKQEAQRELISIGLQTLMAKLAS